MSTWRSGNLPWSRGLASIALLWLVMPTQAHAQAARIDRISSPAARRGEVVTVNGAGFGALNVQITVGGIAARVLGATGNQATFRVPDEAPIGATFIQVTNPGGRMGAAPFRVLEGVLLAGNPGALAVDAVVNVAPVPVDASQVVDGVIMSRLDVHLTAGATVADINAALQRVSGGIVTMLRHYPAMTIAVPPATEIDGLTRAVQTLRTSRGIAWADIAHVASAKLLPPGSAGETINFDQLAHLLAARFPAAWNVSQLATADCASRKVTVLVADEFPLPLVGAETNFVDEVPNFVHQGGASLSDEMHGYSVTTTLAALLNDANPTGANPFADCLSIEGVEVTGLTEFQRVWLIPNLFPGGKFLLNYSQGYPDRCPHTPNRDDDVCTAGRVGAQLDVPVSRAYAAADWKALTSSRWNDFLIGVAAGNEANKPGTAIYPGLGRAAFDSPMSLATLPDLLDFVADGASWDAHAQPGTGGFPTITASGSDIQALQQYLAAIGADAINTADNVLMVGSTTQADFTGAVSESASSDSGPDVMAVGEQIPVLSTDGLAPEFGTSFSAPQVTGLASYLWLLSGGIAARHPAIASLTDSPASATRAAIIANTQQAGLATGAGLIDAYAAVLSLDAAAAPTRATAPVRLQLLNVNTGGASVDRFDEADIAEFLSHLVVVDANGAPIEPDTRDYGRYDINGDGFTGGSRQARFDLDRVDSTQFGGTGYHTVTQSIEDQPLPFNEDALTDLDILCYYAYSDLYEGDHDMRRQLLSHLPGEPCIAAVRVRVDPATATLAPGGTQQFTATVEGSHDTSVRWTANGGTISNTGFFTAGSAPGTFNVTATSVADSTKTATAHVTIAAPQPGHGSGSVLANAGAHAQNDPECRDLALQVSDVQSFSRQFHCTGTFETIDHRLLTGDAQASTTFNETDVLGQLTEATATGIYKTTADGPQNPQLPIGQNNTTSESAGSYKLVFTVTQPRVVTLTGTLTGNAFSTFMQFSCGSGFGNQPGSGPVARTFTVPAGGLCVISVSSTAKSRIQPVPFDESATAGFDLHVTVR